MNFLLIQEIRSKRTWGYFTVQMEEDRQRRAAEKAALNAKLQETHALNVRLAIIAWEKREAARRAAAERAREKASRKKAAVNPLQALWDANGAAIYEANQAFKTKYGKNMSAKVRRKAIKDATRNGHFNAGVYAGNLVKAVTPPPPPKKKNPYVGAADRIRAAANEIDDEKKIGYVDSERDEVRKLIALNEQKNAPIDSATTSYMAMGAAVEAGKFSKEEYDKARVQTEEKKPWWKKAWNTVKTKSTEFASNASSSIAGALSPRPKVSPYKTASLSSLGGSPNPLLQDDDPSPESKDCSEWLWGTRWICKLLRGTGNNQKQPVPTPTPALDPTLSAVLTEVVAGLTPTAQPTFTPTATPTMTPSPTSIPTAIPVYTPVPGGKGPYSFYRYGKKFFDILDPANPQNLNRPHQWWDNYQGEPFGEKTFLAITYNYEIASIGNDPIAKELATEAFARRYWQSQLDYGPDGKYYYLGGRDSVWTRANNNVAGIYESDYDMNFSMIEAEKILSNVDWQNGVAREKPYDWGNPFSALNPKTTARIKHFLPDFWKALQTGNVGPADNQILYISEDGNFFIITKGQNEVLCLNQSCVNPFPDIPLP